MSGQNTPWQMRENNRFQDGTYKRLPWCDRPIWQSPAFYAIWREQFPHICINNPQLIAYTQSPEKGIRDIQTPIKPGRYLQKYFGHLLSEEEIRNWVNWFKTGFEPTPFDNIPLEFATTPDEIERIYAMNGPTSCMTKMEAVRVYGAGDLAIAYLKDPDIQEGILARAICWPEKRLFGRVYPEPAGTSGTGLKGIALQQALRKAGYERATRSIRGKSLHGARLLKIPSDQYRDNYLMPYIDDAEGVDDRGTYFTLHVGTTPEHFTKSTTGFLLPIDDDEEEEPEAAFTCDYCEETFYGDDFHSYEVVVSYFSGNNRRFIWGDWCEHCMRENTFYCELTEQYYNKALFTEVECIEGHRQHFSAEKSNALQNNFYECAVTGFYYLQDKYPPHILLNPDPNGDNLWVCPSVAWDMVEADMTIPAA